jgi:hypothetical protein
MIFAPNPDGSINIYSTAPSIILSGGVEGTDYSSGLPTLNYATPVPSAQNGVFVQSILAGTNPTTTNTGNGQAGFYRAFGIIHTQFGADPANTIYDFFQPLPVTYGYGSFTSTLTGEPVVYLNEISVAGGTLSAQLSTAQLANPYAAEGVYAIAYIGVQAIPDQDNGVPPAAWWLGSYDYGTNSTGGIAPPPAPLNLVASLNNQQATLTWEEIGQGSAPLAGFKISWSTTEGGPYPNSVSVPIGQFNPINSVYTYSFPSGQFPFNGSTQYFVVQGYDNGTSPAGGETVNPSSITYFPAPIAASPVADS